MSVDAASATWPGLFYPDISSGQGAMDLSGIYAVCIKCTEGTYYRSPVYAAQVARAEAAGAFVFAYHFLTDEDPAAQARFCFDNAGPHVGLMVDVETETITGAKPALAQNIGFVQQYRGLGGTIHLEYLPQWYWNDPWGSPDLTPLKNLNLVLVSSNYSGYSTGNGWREYGGWHPTIWQYSSSVPLHGQQVDFNAFLGSGATNAQELVTELKSVVMTGSLPSRQTWQELVTTGNQSLQDIAGACKMDPATILRATAVHYGLYDPVTGRYVDQVFAGAPASAKIPAGAKLWVLK
jgi:hypothetical protein